MRRNKDLLDLIMWIVAEEVTITKFGLRQHNELRQLFSEDEIRYHIDLLISVGYLEKKVFEREKDVFDAGVFLTWEGNDVLDSENMRRKADVIRAVKRQNR